MKASIYMAESMRNYGDLWKVMGIYWKLWGFMVFIGDLWEIMGIIIEFVGCHGISWNL